MERRIKPSGGGRAVSGVAEPPCGSAQRNDPAGVDGEASGEDASATVSSATRDTACADLPTASGIIKAGVRHGEAAD